VVTSPAGDYTATLPRKRMGAAVLLRDRTDRILVVEPVDWVPPRAGRTEGVMFVFDGGVLDPATVRFHLPADELRGWAWSTLPEAQQRLSPLLARRAAAALQAAPGGVSWFSRRSGSAPQRSGRPYDPYQED
jgi:8-oxo-dGTP diphosphatase